MQSDHYDVVVIGGAFSGSVSATLLKRWSPESRVLVVETSKAFDRKVGEATVEISAMMLSRVLGLHDLMAREQLPKHGLRYWFADGPDRTLAEMAEVGPREVPRLPAFQLDRAVNDQRLFELAAHEGAEIARPAKVVGLELGWPQSKLTVESAAGRRQVTTRWVIDASGRHAVIARKLGILKRTPEHPTAAAWGRWEGIADMDGVEMTGLDARHPKLKPIQAARRLATNHFCGYGWWCWVIPLASGATSIGVVYDKRHFEWPPAGSLKARYLAFLRSQPGLRELIAQGRLDEEDFRSYAHLPYCAKQYMSRGWALVGDAASFLDPYYSPGLDHASISAFATARLIEADLKGELSAEKLDAEIEDHNARFLRSYRRWISALYVDKYEYMGDAELTGASFLMDTAMYYMGVVTPIYEDLDNLRHPLFGQPIAQTRIAYLLMRFYHRRLVSIARRRRRLGTYGHRNRSLQVLVRTAGLGFSGGLPMFKEGAKLWLKAELSTLGHRLRGARVKAPAAAPATAPPARVEADAAT